MTNISNQETTHNTSFIAGDIVVLIPEGAMNGLLEVVGHLQTSSMCKVRILATGACGPVFKKDIRLATTEEKKVKRRLPNSLSKDAQKEAS